MKRYRQTIEQLVAALSAIEASWRDKHAEEVLRLIDSIPVHRQYDRGMLKRLVDTHFDAGLTVIRLALDISKDEMMVALRAQLPSGSLGSSRYGNRPDDFLDALVRIGAADAIQAVVHTAMSWKTILVERLKSGRGSAIKGQSRGRFLEDATELILNRVFGSKKYDVRCRFLGATGTSTEKADFAMPA